MTRNEVCVYSIQMQFSFLNIFHLWLLEPAGVEALDVEAAFMTNWNSGGSS
jgi:hypothetical protein